ncbi:MAG: hypothetical protein GY835_28025 [bacterium]|nr:hypothetical protein [bacterium]
MTISNLREYNRIPEHLWNDARFNRISRNAQLLFCHLATGPYKHPRSTGYIPRVSDAQIVDVLISDGSLWTTEEVQTARMELEEANLILYDSNSRSYFIKECYFEATSIKWWKGRMKQLVNSPASAIRTHLVNLSIAEAKQPRGSERGKPKPTWAESESEFLLQATTLMKEDMGINTSINTGIEPDSGSSSELPTSSGLSARTQAPVSNLGAASPSNAKDFTPIGDIVKRLNLGEAKAVRDKPTT